MSQITPKRKEVDILRNLRIVTLHNKGMSFNAIARLLNSQSETTVSPQLCANVYNTWKNVPFRYEDDKVIIQ